MSYRPLPSSVSLPEMQRVVNRLCDLIESGNQQNAQRQTQSAGGNAALGATSSGVKAVQFTNHNDLANRNATGAHTAAAIAYTDVRGEALDVQSEVGRLTAFHENPSRRNFEVKSGEQAIFADEYEVTLGLETVIDGGEIVVFPVKPAKPAHNTFSGRDAVGAHPATAVSTTTFGASLATTVQGWLEALQAESEAARNDIGDIQTELATDVVHITGTETITGDKTFSGTTKTGLAYLGNYSGGNYLQVGTDGFMKAFGDATGWRDELNDLVKSAANNPASRLVFDFDEGALVFKTNATTSDWAIMNAQINHDWKAGSPVIPHIHWWQTENNTPNWLIQYRWQRNGQAKTTAWTSAKWSTNAYTYVSGILCQRSGFAAITPPAGYSLSDILQVRFIRDTTNASGLFTGADPFTTDVSALSSDVHIEIDTPLGSNTTESK